MEFLHLAERLVLEAGDEAAQRSAISRAYYAAYHAAAVVVRARRLLPTGHTHSTVWAASSGSSDPNLSDIGQHGVLLKTLRVNADYRNPFPGDTAENTRQAVVEAAALIDDMEALVGR